MDQGKIVLESTHKNFIAGFCLVKAQLADLIRHYFILHTDEIKYYETLVFDRRKASYLSGRIVAKKAISELVSIDNIQSVFIDFGIFKFPVVKIANHSNIQVSISHCDDLAVALAFSEEHPLGIDVENINPDKLGTMKTMVSEKELALLSACKLSVLIGCTIIWSVKESLSKILKTGLTIDFKLLEIQSIEKSGVNYISTFRYFSQYKAISGQAGLFVCSIALPKNSAAELAGFWQSFQKQATSKVY